MQLSLIIACIGSIAGAESKDYDEAFRSLSYGERRRLIHELSPAARVRAYLDMVSEHRPPDLALGLDMVKNDGADVAAAAARALEVEEALRASWLIMLLADLQTTGRADVRRDEHLVRLAEQVVASMENDTLYRKRSEEWLDEIKGSSEHPSPDEQRENQVPP
jgi:hypothetical protein